MARPYVMRRRVLLAPSRLPCTPPPFGSLVAVDLRTGALRWNVPLGSASRLLPKELADKAPPGLGLAESWRSDRHRRRAGIHRRGARRRAACLRHRHRAPDLDRASTRERQGDADELPARIRRTVRRHRRRRRGRVGGGRSCGRLQAAPMSTEPGGVLQRRFGLVQATALNMINMIGIGPFITIPLLDDRARRAAGDARLARRADHRHLRRHGLERARRGDAAVRADRSATCARRSARETFGRLMAFLFVWQFILSGPLEIASGYIGFSQLSRLHLAVGDTANAVRRGRGGRRAEHRAALPPHHVDRAHHRQPLGRHAAHDSGRDRHRRDSLRSEDRVRLPAGRASTSRSAS